MFKQLAAIFLLLAFSAQMFSHAFIVLDYYTNTAAFAKNCENKAVPRMHCNGKCQMMKKLKQQEKKEQQSPERKGYKNNELISCRSFFTIVDFEKTNSLQSFSIYDAIHFPHGIYTDIFHPPGLV